MKKLGNLKFWIFNDFVFYFKCLSNYFRFRNLFYIWNIFFKILTMCNDLKPTEYMGGHATVIWNFHFSSSISFLISQVGFSWLTPITTAGILILSKALSHSFFPSFLVLVGSGHYTLLHSWTNKNWASDFNWDDGWCVMMEFRRL